MAGLESFCSAARWTGLSGNGRDSWTSLGGGAGVAAGGCALACLDDTTSSQPARKIAPAANNAQIPACLFITITSSSKFLKHVPGANTARQATRNLTKRHRSGQWDLAYPSLTISRHRVLENFRARCLAQALTTVLDRESVHPAV